MPAKTEGVAARDRSGRRHVPWHHSVGKKRCGSALTGRAKRRGCFVRETEVEARASARAVGSVGVGGESVAGMCPPTERSVGAVCSRWCGGKRVKLRHVPGHVPWVQWVREKRCGSVAGVCSPAGDT